MKWIKTISKFILLQMSLVVLFVGFSKAWIMPHYPELDGYVIPFFALCAAVFLGVLLALIKFVLSKRKKQAPLVKIGNLACSFCSGDPSKLIPLIIKEQVLIDGSRVNVAVCKACIEAILKLIAEHEQSEQKIDKNQESETSNLIYCSFCSKNHKQVKTIISGGKWFRDDSEFGNPQYYIYKDSFMYQTESLQKTLHFMGELLICNECAQLANKPG